MEDEKKVTASKRKKTVSTSKKSSTAKSNAAENILELDDFKIDLVGEVKPATKTKSAEKKSPVTKKTAQESAMEVSKTVDVGESSSREQETVPADSESTNGKSTAKPAKKDLDVDVFLTGELPSAAEETKDLPQATASAKPEIVSSATMTSGETENIESGENEAEEDLIERSPVFKELATPKLPELQPENRAWLQMQSPTRIFFYWSLKVNPYETLQKVFGGKNGNYALSVKLQNLTAGTEIIYPLAPFGSAWFDVKSNSTYRAEVGFFDPYRPFIRLIFSNTLETPRLAPSPNLDLSPQFTVTPQEFAEVLDVSGYKQDAFEMALSNDNLEASNEATYDAFEQLTGARGVEIDPAELRLVLFALASGLSLDDLRGQISPELFAYLEKLIRENAADLSSEKILAILQEHFGLGSPEPEDETDEVTYSVFGSSLINFQKFPKTFWRRFEPIGSSKVVK